MAVGALFPGDAPTFITRVPHGYFDVELVAADLASAGFDRNPAFDRVPRTSRAAHAGTAAHAYVLGTPLRAEIERRDATKLGAAEVAADRALAERFGDGPIEGRMSAFVIDISK